MARDSLKERLLARIRKTDSGCWEWTSSYTPGGYGLVTVGRGDAKKTVLAHRTSWLEFRGLIPPGLHVLHRCDNPPCINPDHLFVGTHSDNLKDAYAKGRVKPPIHRGSDQWMAKLTAADVIQIRASNERAIVLGAKYGVSRMTITDARMGRTWAWV